VTFVWLSLGFTVGCIIGAGTLALLQWIDRA